MEEPFTEELILSAMIHKRMCCAQTSKGALLLQKIISPTFAVG
jgi:hypothetical protein